MVRPTNWIAAGGSVTTLETNMGWKHDGRMAGIYTRPAATQLAADDARRIAEVRAGRARHLHAVGDNCRASHGAAVIAHPCLGLRVIVLVVVAALHRWAMRDSNPRPSACHADALTI